jgi:pimeloyl-ACP methyl ester carboxylesterase
MRLILAALVALVIAPVCAAEPTSDRTPIPTSVVADAPKDRAHPAGMLAFALPTKGVKINAVFFSAAGAGPHPTVLLLHGLPGNEQNLDLARAMQREGWNVLTLHYRGSWGSPGQYSVGHCLEDAAAALAWLRDPNTAAAPGIDASKIVVIGHSLGGFVAAYTGAHDPAVMATGLISAANLGGGMGAVGKAGATKIIDDNIGTSAGMHTLNASPEALADEVVRNAKDWNFTDWAEALAKHPLLIITSDDGLAASNEALRDKTKAVGGDPTYVHIATDHSYDDQRITLEAAVIRWLENLPGAPAGL